MVIIGIIPADFFPWSLRLHAENITSFKLQTISPLSTMNPASIPLHSSSDNQNTIKLHSRMIGASKILSLRQLFGDWHGSLNTQRMNLAIINGESGLIFGRDYWQIAYIRRIEMFLWANRGITEFIWYDKNKIPLHPDRVFSFAMKGQGFEADAFKFSRGWDLQVMIGPFPPFLWPQQGEPAHPPGRTWGKPKRP